LAEKIGPILKQSEVYETEPWGFDSTQLFLNQALEIQTSRKPAEILHLISEIEQAMGRTHTKERYASRTLDIDILLIGSLCIEEPDLQVPHPRMHLRKFALVPLAEIAGNRVHPVLNKDIKTLLEDCKDPLNVLAVPASRKERPALPYRFISIEGNIGSGKTSLATLLAERIDAQLILERFEDNDFLPRFYEDPAQFAFTLEMSFLTDRYQQMKEAFKAGNLFPTSVVSDYFIDKSYVFARQNLNREEFRLFSRMFDILAALLPKPDLVVFLHNELESLKKNILKRGRPYEKNISFEYIDRLQQGYLSYFRQLTDQTILILDIRNLDFVATNESFSSICKLLQKKYPPGVHRVGVADHGTGDPL
jgi:2-amino-4-hydroxy-6-hydroxymethyldihydropteridine diphosphokinase